MHRILLQGELGAVLCAPRRLHVVGGLRKEGNPHPRCPLCGAQPPACLFVSPKPLSLSQAEVLWRASNRNEMRSNPLLPPSHSECQPSNFNSHKLCRHVPRHSSLLSFPKGLKPGRYRSQIKAVKVGGDPLQGNQIPSGRILNPQTHRKPPRLAARPPAAAHSPSDHRL